jgi:hypothetical protein
MEKGGIINVPEDLLSYECHSKHAAPSFQEIEELDNKLSQLETEVKEMNDNESNLQRNYLELVELEVGDSFPSVCSKHAEREGGRFAINRSFMETVRCSIS